MYVYIHVFIENTQIYLSYIDIFVIFVIYTSCSSPENKLICCIYTYLQCIYRYIYHIQIYLLYIDIFVIYTSCSSPENKHEGNKVQVRRGKKRTSMEIVPNKTLSLSLSLSLFLSLSLSLSLFLSLSKDHFFFKLETVTSRT